jgi:transposase
MLIHPSSVAVSREHRRAKTDRLDTELLKRGFLGWLRGERGHCSMARVPTIAEEDAKRPNRERDGLVRERTRIVNRIKCTLARLGIRNFKPTLRKAAERLATVHTRRACRCRQMTHGTGWRADDRQGNGGPAQARRPSLSQNRLSWKIDLLFWVGEDVSWRPSGHPGILPISQCRIIHIASSKFIGNSLWS